MATAAAAGATEATTAARTVPGASGAAATTVTARGEAPATEVEAATAEKAPRVVAVALAIAAGVPWAVEIAREATRAAKAATAVARAAARQMEAHRYRSEEVVVDRSGERFGRCRLVLSAREADRDCPTAGSRLRSRTASTAE
jgi:hypothetical protein